MKITVTKKNVKIASTANPDAMLLLIKSLGPPCVAKFTFAPRSGKITQSVAAAATAPINCEKLS
jgi:hypothetical protein